MKFNLFNAAFVLACILIIGCTPSSKKTQKSKNLSFIAVKGIRFYEVKRRFSNGLSFNQMGFMQEPSWIIEVKDKDTILAYSPEKNKMEHFYLQFDHDNIYNFAREFFRVKLITKDSLLLQRLQVTGKLIESGIKSDVHATYYSANYIKNKLHTTAKQLQKPSKKDTLYIKALAAKANNNPSNAAFAFAGRVPVVFTPLSNRVIAEKAITVNSVIGRTASYDYLFPKYYLTINRAYKNFAYTFTVVVGPNGKIYLANIGQALEPAVRKKVLAGIISVYLQNLFKITPGSTLGIAHASEVTVAVQGIK